LALHHFLHVDGSDFHGNEFDGLSVHGQLAGFDARRAFL
jgi:hypothetical protein